MRLHLYIFWIFLSFFPLAVSAQTAFSAAGTYASSSEISADALEGTWAPADNAFQVKIEKIGNKYYGKLVWLGNPNDESGNPKTDKLNPDASLRSVPFIGLRTLKDMQYTGNGTWGKGTIYDPETGKTYDCKITLENIDTAMIRGFVGLSFLGKTIPFRRVQ